MTFERCDGCAGIHCVSCVDSWSPGMGVEDIKTGVGVDLCLEYGSDGDWLNRDELDGVFTGGLGSRDFGVGFGLEDTRDGACWS